MTLPRSAAAAAAAGSRFAFIFVFYAGTGGTRASLPKKFYETEIEISICSSGRVL